MLQLAIIRQQPDWVRERLAVKHFPELNLIDEVLALDERRRKLQADFDAAQSRVNSISKEIGGLMARGEKSAAEEKKQEVATLKSSLTPISEQLQEAEKLQQELLLKLPNIPSDLVPPGKAAEDNVVVRSGGPEAHLPADAQAHWDLIVKYDLIDFETGSKLTGRGFPVYKNRGAKLQRALVQYFLDYNTNAGYTEYQPPLLVNEASAFGTTQLPDKEGQMYHVTADNFYLIPTSEVPLTNIYRDEILKESDLPVKLTGYTPCFRREAGSFGKDVRGLNRLHQFDKVEIVQLVHPEKSYQVLEEMVEHVERLLQSLELPYRLLRLCGGDMSFSSALTYDFEVYSAAQQRWLEVSSVSNFETFQTNRLKARFKDEAGKIHLLHSLNGSSLALPRILACLIENNQREDGIHLPSVLHRYFGDTKIS